MFSSVLLLQEITWCVKNILGSFQCDNMTIEDVLDLLFKFSYEIIQNEIISSNFLLDKTNIRCIYSGMFF